MVLRYRLGRHKRLSVGQNNSLTIARALLKDAPLLILDEATSSVSILGRRIIDSEKLWISFDGEAELPLLSPPLCLAIRNAQDLKILVIQG